MMWKLVLIAMLVAAAALAVMPTGERKIEADGAVTIMGTEVELLADGEARVTIYRTVSGKVSRAPIAAASDTFFTLYDNMPRVFSNPSGIDSLKIMLVDATYVQVSWR
jgi:hypothetical protein